MTGTHCFTIYGKNTAEIKDIRDFLLDSFSDALELRTAEPVSNDELADHGYNYAQTVYFKNGTGFDDAMNLSDEMATAAKTQGVTISRCLDSTRARGWRQNFAQRFMLN